MVCHEWPVSRWLPYPDCMRLLVLLHMSGHTWIISPDWDLQRLLFSEGGIIHADNRCIFYCLFCCVWLLFEIYCLSFLLKISHQINPCVCSLCLVVGALPSFCSPSLLSSSRVASLFMCRCLHSCTLWQQDGISPSVWVRPSLVLPTFFVLCVSLCGDFVLSICNFSSPVQKRHKSAC